MWIFIWNCSFFSLSLGDEGNWQWTHSHDLITDSYWATNRPNNRTGNADDCGLMALRGSSFVWEDHSCLVQDIQQRAVAPICQHNSAAASTTVPPPTTTALECTPGWTEFQGHCYKAQSTNRYWADAELDCVNFGGHLASVHSRAEQDLVDSFFTSGNYFWIGGTGTGYHDGWRWSDGSAWDYECWYDETSSSSYQCLRSRAAYGWANYYCSNNAYPYVCKI